MSSITKNIATPIEAASGDGNNRVRVEFRRFAIPSNWLLAILVIPMLIALGISGYLTYVSLTASKIVGCSGGELFDCSHVIYSKWSKVFGIPVSALALGTYLAMLAAAGVVAMKKLSSPVRLMSWSVLTGLAIAAALAALYFIFLQVFVLEHLCPWCLGAHACGLLIAASVLLCKSRIALPPLGIVSSMAVAGLAVMVAVQVSAKEPPKYEVIQYVPESNSSAPGPELDETFTAAAPVDESADEDVFMPPGEDEDLFAPPEDSDFEDDDSFMEPPSEDLDSAAASLKQIMRLGVCLTSQLTAAIPVPSALILQEPARKQQNSQAAASQSEAKKQQSEAKKQHSSAKTKKKKRKPEPRIVEFMGKKLNAHQWPVDGSPTAKHVFVEMFDYTCPHCRSTSQAIFKVKEQMGDDLAVVALPVPMNTRCNASVLRDHPAHLESCELAVLAVAVWRCDSGKFPEFHKWMFQGKDAPVYSAALGKAIELVGKEPIERELNKKTSRAYVKRHCQMYKALNAGVVPKLLFPRSAVQGEFTAVDPLASMIREKCSQ